MSEKPLDAILLSLHGAMVTTESIDPEGELLARIRAKPGLATIPISGSYDLHANFTQRMGQHANALVGFRHNPHTDARETSVRAAELLARMLDSGTVSHMRVKHAPVIWSPPGTGTADRPMKDLEALARQIEAENPTSGCAMSSPAIRSPTCRMPACRSRSSRRQRRSGRRRTRPAGGDGDRTA
jgi:microcystin degradation protein MlrC